MSVLERTGALSVFERLREPVAACESSTHDLFTCNDALINEFEGRVDNKDVLALCKPTLSVYPITPALQIRPCVPSFVWRDSTTRLDMHKHWQTCIDGYRGLDTSQAYPTLLRNEIDTRWGIPLFGIHCNALTPVLSLASRCVHPTYACNFVIHYVTMVVLQYYTMRRSQWLESCEDHTKAFSDRRPPHICMLFLRYDIKSDHCAIDFSSTQFDKAALEYDFTSLLRAVLVHLMPLANAFMLELNPQAPQIKLPKIKDWISNKVFVTKLQLLVTSRFVLMHVDQLSQHVVRSLNLEDTPSAGCIVNDAMTKHYLLPMHHRLKNANFPGTDPMNNDSRKNLRDVFQGDSMRLSANQTRVPNFICHSSFSPVEPLAAFEPELQRFALVSAKDCTTLETQKGRDQWMHQTLYQASKVMDSTLAGRLQKTVNTERTAFPKLKGLHLAQLHINLYRDVDLVRLRHSFTLQRQKLYTRLADALQLPVSSETSPRFISQPAWKWMMRTAKARDIWSTPRFSRVAAFGYSPMREPYHGLEHESFLQVYVQDAWELDANSFDYLCVYHAVMVTKDPDSMRDNIDQFMLMRGLVCVLESERDAALETVRLTSADPLQDSHNVLQRVRESHDRCARLVKRSVMRMIAPDTHAQHAVSLMIKAWRHNPCDLVDFTHANRRKVVTPIVIRHQLLRELGAVRLLESEDPEEAILSDNEDHLMRDAPADAASSEQELDPELDEWLNAACEFASNEMQRPPQLLDYMQNRVLRSERIGLAQLGLLRKMVCHIARSMHSSLDAFRVMCCPLPHIEATQDTTWRDLSSFQAQTPEISALLHSVVTHARSDRFVAELRSLTLKVHRQEPLHPMAHSMLDACHHVLLGVEHLTSSHASSALQNDIASLSMSSESRSQPVAVLQRDALHRASQRFIVETSLLRTPMDEAIRIVVRLLSEQFDLTQLAQRTLDALFSGSRELSLAVLRHLQTNHNDHVLAVLQQELRASPREELQLRIAQQ